MPVKIRLQRHGRKGKAYFHIVVADARSPRDGKYIERLGFYNPNTNPATIDLDVDGAVKWLGNGAQPTDTARAILSYKGVLYKNHLLKGVVKGALSEEDVESRFNAWIEEKQGKIEQKKQGLSDAAVKAEKDRLEAESEVNKARAAAIAAANAPVEEVVDATPSDETPEAEVSAEEAPVAEQTAAEEAPAAEAPVEEAPAAETPVEEAPKAEEAEVEEPKAEEVKVEEPKAEETKVEEPKAEEAPKAEAAPEEVKAEETAGESEDEKNK